MENVEGEAPDRSVPAADPHAAGWLTRIVVVVTAALFIAMSIRPDSWEPEMIKRWGAVSAFGIYEGAYWSLLSSVFVHGDFIHAGFNLYWMWILGIPLERAVGKWRWVMLFLGSAWVSSAMQLAFSSSAGIGLSGVLYAIFGFMWRARSKYPSFQAVVTPQVIQWLLLWLVICFPLTASGVLNIGNAAHVSGLLCGVAVAEAALGRRTRALFASAVLLIASTASLFYAPWSPAWHAFRGERAFDAERWGEAKRYYHRAIELDARVSEFVWVRLAWVAYYEDKLADLRLAVAALGSLNPDAADELEPILCFAETFALAREGRYDEASKRVVQALAIADRADLHELAGVTAVLRDDGEAAATSFREAIKMDPVHRIYSRLFLWTVDAGRGRRLRADKELSEYIRWLGGRRREFMGPGAGRVSLGPHRQESAARTRRPRN
ncbi:MAG: rhomboid family intramembrane serine protease [Planctomycetota bacterium]